MLVEFADGDVTIGYIEKHYPFLFAELKRQRMSRGALQKVLNRE